MAEKYFVVGIGGTGMRCIEAFTHLCAIGMFDNHEISMLSIDTDTNNGNKGRTEQLIDRYVRIKGGDAGTPTAQSFFTAKLKLYKFAPIYSDDTLTYRRISRLSEGSKEARARNEDLSVLLFDDNVQEFALDHGYRAQTHLGSHLMYHAILDAARKVRDGQGQVGDKDLMAFINQIYDAKDEARVFILGSIFGGTGASAIPIIPKALQDALRLRDPNHALSDKARFGCSLLTDYFKFNDPTGPQLKDQKIIADSNNFARNSQAALMFYDADETVQHTYERMYHVGWPSRVDWSTDTGGGATVTGGGEQKNPAHVAEFLCACAAHDFFHGEHAPEQNERALIVYRSADREGNSFSFGFGDFVGKAFQQALKARLTSLFAMAHMVTSLEGSAINSVKKFEENNVKDYVNLTPDEARDLDAYFRAFAYALEDGKVRKGWLFQLQESVGGPFLYDVDAFSTDPRQLKGLNFGTLLDDEGHQFARKKFLGGSKPYEEFMDTILKDTSMQPRPEQKVQRLNERYLAHCFNAFQKLYNFRS